jgi:hypothetical protein
MHPAHLWRARWLRWVVIRVAAATAVIVAVVVIAAAGPSFSPSAAQIAVPHGPATLVAGARVSDGVQLGFPHTTVGAISAAADMVSEVFSSVDPSHAEAAMRLVADSSYPIAPELAFQVVESYRQAAGLAATGPVPAGYTLSFTSLEYQVRDVSADKVMVILLSESSFTEPANEYQLVGVLAFPMHWEHGDWKVAGNAETKYPRLNAKPYSSRAAKLGWKPLRLPVIVAMGPSSRPGAAQAAVPRGPVTLIPGARVSDGVQLGFPHTTVGAISAAAYLVYETFGLDPSHAEAAMQLLADSSYPTAPYDSALGAESLRQSLGLAATGPVPAGYRVTFTPVEYQVRDVTADKVMVVLLVDSFYSEPGRKDYLRIGVLPFLMHWEHGDWKDAGDTTTQYMSLYANPDSSRADELGWKPLRPPV